MSIWESKNRKSNTNFISKKTIEFDNGTENKINGKTVKSLLITNLENVKNNQINTVKNPKILIRNNIFENKVTIKIKVYITNISIKSTTM
jgi:hypothetical protein